MARVVAKSVRELAHTNDCEHPAKPQPGEPTGLGEFLERCRTHRLTQCKHCELYVIWEPRK